MSGERLRIIRSKEGVGSHEKNSWCLVTFLGLRSCYIDESSKAQVAERLDGWYSLYTMATVIHEAWSMTAVLFIHSRHTNAIFPPQIASSYRA